MSRTVLAATIALALSGCALGPAYQRPDVKLPTSFPETLPAEMATAAPEAVAPDWWSLFGDPTLNEMVQSALANNRDIQLAVARIEEANANLRAVNAAFLPEIDVTGGGSRSAVPQAQSIRGASVSNSWRIGLSSTFEIDFWGRIRSGVDAARAAVLASRDAADVVRVTTAGVTTQTYFAVRSLDSQIAATEATLGTRTEALRLVRRRAEAGVASDLEVAQSEGAVVDASAQLKDLIRQRAIALHALGILTGRLDLALDRSDLLKLPEPALPPPGLPSTLLARRPDIRQAEYQLIAANAQIGLARAALFPTISLTAALGTTSPALHALLDSPNRTWSIGGNLLGPLFDAGRRQAQVEAEEARTRQAVVNYRQVVERSFREVADALIAVRQASAAEADLQTGLRAATNALRLATLRYDAGYSGFLEVLDAQRTFNNAQLALVRNRQALLAADVDLMRALGGGWLPDSGLPTAAATPEPS